MIRKFYFFIITVLISLIFVNYSFAQTTITFSGIKWIVRSGTGGPGPNNWSNSSSSVWVDSQGRLHMKIRKIDNTWYCSEIYAQQSMGYGEYKFYVSSNVENFDPNIVVGLFLYESDSKEVDIEFSRWSNPSNVDGWYTVQPPPYNSSNQNSFPLNLTGDYSTHRFVWSSSNIFFQSYHGHYSTLPSSDFLINQWTYTGNNNPAPGNERLHINFWLFQGQPPTNQNEAELIVSSVFVPSGSLKVSLSPSDAVNAGAQWNFDGNAWQNSNVTLNEIPAGSHTINFKDISGWNTPSNQSVTIYNNQITSTSGTYTQQTGSLKVTISPSDAISAGAQWNLDGSSWQNSGVTLNNISLGLHTVSFKDISGWYTPSTKNISIYNNQTTYGAGNYQIMKPSIPILIYPNESAVGIPKDTTFYWRSSNRAVSYKLQISTDTSFIENNIVFNKEWIIDTLQNVTTLEYDTHYYWRVNSTNDGGTSDYSVVQSFTTASPTGIEILNSQKPNNFFLFQNYPNPFNPVTIIKYSVLHQSFVNISIYNTQGKKILTLVNEEKSPGNYKVTFDGNKLSSGIYFYRMISNNFSETKKLILLK